MRRPVDPTAGLVRGLAGDLAFVTGKLPAAADDYLARARTGGVGPCLAARGRARLALATGRREDGGKRARRARRRSVLRSSLTDPETVWVRGRLALAHDDYATARTLLGEIQRSSASRIRGR